MDQGGYKQHPNPDSTSFPSMPDLLPTKILKEMATEIALTTTHQVSTLESFQRTGELQMSQPSSKEEKSTNHQIINQFLSHSCEIQLTVGFDHTSTLVGNFVSSPREREKRYGRDSRGDEREGQGRKRNRIESEETEGATSASIPVVSGCHKELY